MKELENLIAELNDPVRAFSVEKQIRVLEGLLADKEFVPKENFLFLAREFFRQKQTIQSLTKEIAKRDLGL